MLVAKWYFGILILRMPPWDEESRHDVPTPAQEIARLAAAVAADAPLVGHLAAFLPLRAVPASLGELSRAWRFAAAQHVAARRLVGTAE